MTDFSFEIKMTGTGELNKLLELFSVALAEPRRTGQITINHGVAGFCVGQWRAFGFGMDNGSSHSIPCRIERIQPNDGDGRGFVVLGTYDKFPIGELEQLA